MLIKVPDILLYWKVLEKMNRGRERETKEKKGKGEEKDGESDDLMFSHTH